ncbi:MAG: response regulator transcription factor [Streptosporangiaceae bacterium]|nr:response regulator transcription factor [Streptosporangiaceae bacterium]MBV9853348.1 response regulator transcription factor [Streptosporangiaceae bacterium]
MTREPRSPAAGRRVVFVAEHEPEVAEMMRRYLERAAIRVLATGSPAETLAMLGDPAEPPAALFVLDLTMPGLDVRRVRRALTSGAQVPVVFLVDGHGVRPRGLSGPAARDRRWITRPFSPRTLVTAVTELLRPPPAAPRAALVPPAPASPAPASPAPASPAPLPPGEPLATSAPPSPAAAGAALALDPAHRAVTVAGQSVPLTRTEYALIAALAARPGRVLSRAALLAALEDTRGKSPGARAVDVYITQLRFKLPAVTIRTVRGIGYVLDLPR